MFSFNPRNNNFTPKGINSCGLQWVHHLTSVDKNQNFTTNAGMSLIDQGPPCLYCLMLHLPLRGSRAHGVSLSSSITSSTLMSATSSGKSSTERFSLRPSRGPNHIPVTSGSPLFAARGSSPNPSRPRRSPSSSGSELSRKPGTELQTWVQRGSSSHSANH